MASCVYCNDSSSAYLMNGWVSETGKFAQLCNSCYSVYNAGHFCLKFHKDEKGWRDCKSCSKPIHCGCIVSLDDYLMHDLGGILCVDCSRTEYLQAQRRLHAESNPQDGEMQLIPPPPEPVMTFLFQKLMTPSDAKYRNSRIVLPKKSALEHFPAVSEGERLPLSILDTDGQMWNVCYRCWVHGKNKMYVLQGLKDYMVSKNLQVGDTVSFYRRDSDEQIVIEWRKAMPSVPDVIRRQPDVNGESSNSGSMDAC